MRRVFLVGILLMSVSSFLAMQAICRPYVICAKMTCEAGGKPATVLEACAPSVAECRSGCGACPADGPSGMDFSAGLPCANLQRPCMSEADFSSDNTCCEKRDVPAKNEGCPNRVLSCVFCIPARFIWEPPSVHAIRDLETSKLYAAAATIALAFADLARRQIHTHSPPVEPPMLAGADRRISNCSFLL